MDEMAVYADTSFLLSTISTESSSDKARAELDRVIASGEQIQTSIITRIEMARAIANRGIDPEVSAFINRQLIFIDIDETIVQGAIELGIPRTASFLRTLDAIHIATARKLAVKTVLTFDNRQIEVCRSIGLDASPLD
jgi:predicted nucleic acid-binding protein